MKHKGIICSILAYELGKRLVKDASYLLKKRIFIIIIQKIVVPLCRTSKGHT